MASCGIELVTVPKHGVSHASHPLGNFKGKNSLLTFRAALCGNGSSEAVIKDLGNSYTSGQLEVAEACAPVVVVE